MSRIEELMSKGFKLLEEQRFDEAVKVGEQLRELRHTSAFEILGLAYAGLEDKQQAVKILEMGVEKGPSIWLLWQLLGNYRSDLGLYAEAQEAYTKALVCPDVDTSSVHLNMSIALTRQGRYDEAMPHLQEVTGQLHSRAEAQRVHILVHQEKWDEAIRLGQQLVDTLNRREDPECLAEVEAERARAYWRGHRDRDRALSHAREALLLRHAEPTALWVIRDVEGRFSDKAKYLRLLLEGDWAEPDPDDGPLGFIINYDVVAETPEDALNFIRRFEPFEVQASLRVHECTEVEARPHDPMGVYSRGAHCLFPRRGEDTG